MNTQAFKKMIQEAVRQAVREELRQLLAEHAAAQLVGTQIPLREDLSFSSNDVGPGFRPKSLKDMAAEKAKMEAMFGKPGKVSLPEGPANKPVPVAGDFSAFLMDTAQNFNPNELLGGD